MGRQVRSQSGSPTTRAAKARESGEEKPPLLRYVLEVTWSMMTENREATAKNVAARPRSERI
jgi:hypothetical protein